MIINEKIQYARDLFFTAMNVNKKHDFKMFDDLVKLMNNEAEKGLYGIVLSNSPNSVNSKYYLLLKGNVELVNLLTQKGYWVRFSDTETEHVNGYAVISWGLH